MVAAAVLTAALVAASLLPSALPPDPQPPPATGAAPVPRFAQLATALLARSAAREFQQAVADARAAARRNGRTLDITTRAGRDNAAALDRIAEAADASATAATENGASGEAAGRILAEARSPYIGAAELMGLAARAADRLADSLHLTPAGANPAAAGTVRGSGTATRTVSWSAVTTQSMLQAVSDFGLAPRAVVGTR